MSANRKGRPSLESTPGLALRRGLSRADRTVAYWEARVAQLDARVQNLDNVVIVAVDTLLGRRERRVDATADAVVAAHDQLDHARQDRDSLQAALAAQEAGRPWADRLRHTEEQVERLHSTLEPLLYAVTAGAGLSTFMDALKGEIDQAAFRTADGDGLTSALGLLPAHHLNRLERALLELPARTMAFEEACAAVGVQLRFAAGPDAAPGQRWLADLATGMVGANLRVLERRATWHSRLDQLLLQVVWALRALRRQHDHLDGQLQDLDDELRGLVPTE